MLGEILIIFGSRTSGNICADIFNYDTFSSNLKIMPITMDKFCEINLSSLSTVLSDPAIKKIIIYDHDVETEIITLDTYNRFREKLNASCVNFKFIHVTTSKSELDNLQFVFQSDYHIIEKNKIEADKLAWKNIFLTNISVEKLINWQMLTTYNPMYHPFKLTKIKVAILNSGQWRVNHTGLHKSDDTADYRSGYSIKNHICKYLLGLNILEHNAVVDVVDMFVSTDDTHIMKTFDYYQNVKAIYLDKYKNIHGDIINRDIIENGDELIKIGDDKIKQCEKKFSTGYKSAQWFKMLMAYRMMEQYEKENNFTYDVVIRIRPDIVTSGYIPYNIISDTVGCVINQTDRVHMRYDIFAVGTRDVMEHYSKLIYNFADYRFMENRYEFKSNGIWTNSEYYGMRDVYRWTLSPEAQLTEHLLKKYGNRETDVMVKTSYSELSNKRVRSTNNM